MLQVGIGLTGDHHDKEKRATLEYSLDCPWGGHFEDEIDSLEGPPQTPWKIVSHISEAC